MAGPMGVGSSLSFEGESVDQVPGAMVRWLSVAPGLLAAEYHEIIAH
jgi:hypothetical protein